MKNITKHIRITTKGDDPNREHSRRYMPGLDGLLALTDTQHSTCVERGNKNQNKKTASLPL